MGEVVVAVIIVIVLALIADLVARWRRHRRPKRWRDDTVCRCCAIHPHPAESWHPWCPTCEMFRIP